MKEIGVVSRKLPAREMSYQQFRDIFPLAKITMFTVYVSIASSLCWSFIL